MFVRHVFVQTLASIVIPLLAYWMLADYPIFTIGVITKKNILQLPQEVVSKSDTPRVVDTTSWLTIGFELFSLV